MNTKAVWSIAVGVVLGFSALASLWLAAGLIYQQGAESQRRATVAAESARLSAIQRENAERLARLEATNRAIAQRILQMAAERMQRETDAVRQQLEEHEKLVERLTQEAAKKYP